jgi:hypothetical protein
MPRKKKSSTKGNPMMKRAMTAAKRIYKANPGKKWTTCVKQGWKEVK